MMGLFPTWAEIAKKDVIDCGTVENENVEPPSLEVTLLKDEYDVTA